LKNSAVKNIILTIDYELFFGEKEGNVDSCMIEPTRLLSDLLAKHQSKMTVFWDILHYRKMLDLLPEHPELSVDIRKIEQQVSELLIAGHDVQLHLHPHWLDTNYVHGKWQFDLTGYRLHSLSTSADPDDIRTISGCITTGKKLIESVCGKTDPAHKVNTFRAGGYCIQPFSELAQPLTENGVFTDSSVCRGFRFDNGQHSYDFSGIPDKARYRFSTNVESEDTKGNFLELPIGSHMVSPLRILWWAFLLRTKYRDLANFGETGATENRESDNNASRPPSFIRKFIRTLREPRFVMLTPDNFFKEKFNYLVDHAPDGSVMILHPKYLNSHTLALLAEQLSSGRVRFRSIKEIIANNG
jgi:hypothetical protein